MIFPHFFQSNLNTVNSSTIFHLPHGSLSRNCWSGWWHRFKRQYSLIYIASYHDCTIYTDWPTDEGIRNGGTAAVVTKGPTTQPKMLTTIKTKGRMLYQLLRGRSSCHGINFNIDIYYCQLTIIHHPYLYR